MENAPVAIQESLDFPGTVYGVARGTPATERMSRQAAWYAAHLDDRPNAADHPLTVSPVRRVTLPRKIASCSAGLSSISSRFLIVARM